MGELGVGGSGWVADEVRDVLAFQSVWAQRNDCNMSSYDLEQRQSV